MPEQDRESRTESATPRRRQEARERGQVARSADLSSAMMLLAGLLFLRFYGPFLLDRLSSLAIQVFGWMGEPGEEGREAFHHIWQLAAALAVMLLPLMLFLAVIGLAINWLQFGFIWSGQPLKLSLDKLNPINGAKRMFSARGLAMLVSCMLKISVGVLVFWLRLRWEIGRIMLLPDLMPGGVLASICGMLFRAGLELVILLLVLAVADYFFQRFQYERDLRMTQQEVREELKRMEGDPAIRARRRAIMRRMVMQQMMRKVPEAQVVITNPTHIAVALRYQPEELAAPEVVAKGQRLVAERIKEIAREHKVPVVENKPLARALFKAVDVGQQVPAHLYEAVAEVLALVYGLSGGGRSGAA
jgi:flagellar biosynthetic protein FlhB